MRRSASAREHGRASWLGRLGLLAVWTVGIGGALGVLAASLLSVDTSRLSAALSDVWTYTFLGAGSFLASLIQGKTPSPADYRNLRVGDLTLKTGVIPDLLDMQVDKYGDRTFLVVPGPEGYREISFREFRQRVDRAKRALYAHGVRSGHRVAFLSPNRPEFVEAAMGVWGLGAMVVSMSFRSPPTVWEHMISNSEAASIVVPGPMLQAARDLRDKNPNLKIFVLDDVPAGKLQEGEVSLAAWQDADASLEVPAPSIALDDIALILYTSGTTKLPKGVPLTHKNLLYNREASRLAWEGDLADEDMTLGWLPFFHVMGLPFEFLGNLYVGARYAFPRLKPGPPTPDQLLAALKGTGANVFYTVPWMLEGMKKMGETDPSVLETLRGLKFIMSGGVVLPESLGEYFHKKGVNVIQGYGMTDVAGALMLGDPKKRDWRAMRLLPGLNAVFDPVEGLDGKELVLERSHTVMPGYVKNPEETKQAFREPGRFHTGDLFTETEGGYVYIERSDDVENLITGEKLVPSPMQRALEESPLIAKAMVTGDQKPYPIAIVQPEYGLLKDKSLEEVEQAVWEVFEKVNPDFADFSRVRRGNMIVLGPEEEPLPLSPKASLVRSQVKKRFADKMEALYARKEEDRKVLEQEPTPSFLGTDHLALVRAFIEELRTLKEVVVAGEDLTIPRIVAAARNAAPVRLTDRWDVKRRVDAAVEWLKTALAQGRIIYGVNTGFGGDADKRIQAVEDLQKELIRFLNAGFGDSLPDETVRAAMLIRVNSNIKGYSALRWEVLENLVTLLNKGVTPIVPEEGSITASGDLVPLAHIVAVLLGMDSAKASYQGRIISAKEALEIAGLQPLVLQAKEGLALVNGTSVANAAAALVLYDANVLALLAQAATALGVEALLGTNQSYDPVIQQVKPHPGQIEVGRNLLHLLKGSRLARDELDGKEKIEEGRMRQDRYSLRTATQWLGPQIEELLRATQWVTTEANSVTDNPIIDVAGDRALHGGNFQGTYLGTAMDQTRAALNDMGALLYGQFKQLVNDKYSNGLPPNLAGSVDPSKDFGLKGSDIAMAHHISKLNFLSEPVRNRMKSDAELGNQDVNSLGLLSALYTRDAVGVLQRILARYLYAVMQAIDLRNVERVYQEAAQQAAKDEVSVKGLKSRLSAAREAALRKGAGHLLGNTRPLYEFIRRDLGVKFNQADAPPGPEIEKIHQAIQDGRILDPLLQAFSSAPTSEEGPLPSASGSAGLGRLAARTAGATAVFLAAIVPARAQTLDVDKALESFGIGFLIVGPLILLFFLLLIRRVQHRG